MFKKILSISLIVALSPLTVVAYSDITAENTNFKAIEFLEDLHIYTDSTFTPSKTINRGELFKILATLKGVTNDSEKIVGVSSALTAYVGGLRSLGIRTRIGEAGFEEDMPVNKVTALRMLLNLEGVFIPKIFNEETYKKALPNLPVSAYYSPLIAKSLDLNLLNIQNDQYNPLEKFTREDLAVMIANMEIYKSKLAIAEGVLPQIFITESALSGGSFINQDQSQILETVWNRIDKNYVFQSEIDKQKVFYGMMTGMVNALGDPFSVFQTPEVHEDFMQSLSDTLEGIGATLNINDAAQLEVISPLNGSPAKAAGLLPEDIILAIDGEATEGRTINDSINKIRGEAGSTVILSILRGTEQLEVSITRAKIEIPFVEYEVSSKDIAILTINSFGNGASEGFQKFIDEVDTTKLKGLIIDLRNNPGGYVSEAANIADFFLEEDKVIVQTQDANLSTLKTFASKDAVLGNLKTVVLINKGSASSSEILAAALQENDKASLLGEQSYGKGTVQEVQVYTDGSSLKLSIAKWLTPLGNSIHGIGLIPDVEVEVTTEDIEAGVDAVMNKALDLF